MLIIPVVDRSHSSHFCIVAFGATAVECPHQLKPSNRQTHILPGLESRCAGLSKGQSSRRGRSLFVMKLLLGGAHTAMVMLRKQWVTFRIRYALHEGSNPACCLDCGWLFNKLHNAKHPSKEKKFLELKQLFWGECSNTFLINLKKKTGLTFVKDVLKQALVPHYICSVEPVATVGEGEKFAPGERRGDRPVMATIEREATTAATAAGISSAEFILVDAEWKATCSYNGQTGKLTRGNREPRGAHDFVEPAADTAQQV